MRKFETIVFSVLLVISLSILGFLYVVTTADDGIDPEYAVEKFEGEIETKDFVFDAFNTLYFLYDRDPITDFTKKTKILGATPKLKIVDSEDYRVEITTHSDAFDKLKISTHKKEDDTDNNRLIITFTDDCYVPVHVDDTSYDYDTGLYVDFDRFEVVVYAPISRLMVDSALILDYQAPKCEEMYVNFSYEGTEAYIYNVNTDKLKLYCGGTSNITLSGKVHGLTEISIWHNTKVDATNLKTERKSFYVTSALFNQFSYVKYNHVYYVFSEIFLVIVKAVLYIPPVIWLVCLIGCLRGKKYKI